ncbi:MAG TPA: hypothetical protein PKE33_10875 [Kiritimatiellia bacterium]|nr:hypothetical protein [Kiritimatiellia bacterium]
MTMLDHAKEPIQAVVTDTSRQKELLDVLKAARQTTATYVEERDKLVKTIFQLQGKTSVSDDALQARLDQLLEATVHYQDDMIRHRFALKGSVTREEWERMFPLMMDGSDRN